MPTDSSWYVAELERGISDDAVLYLANEQDAPLLTADKDFGELVFRGVLKNSKSLFVS